MFIYIYVSSRLGLEISISKMRLRETIFSKSADNRKLMFVFVNLSTSHRHSRMQHTIF